MKKKKIANNQRKPGKIPTGGIAPLITIDESAGERLFIIADFSSPYENNVRRVLSKKLPSGNIWAVVYNGPVGADRVHTEKRDIMVMEDATEKAFMQSIKILQDVYSAVGGTISISNFSGKSMKEAADLMKMTDSGNVFLVDENGNLQQQ